MKAIFLRFRLLLSLVLLACISAPAFAADKLEWDTKKERVTADIQSWNLDTTLEKISTSAGWEVYVEPGSTQQVSTKFANLPVDEALKKMLGKLSFALLPQTNALPKFYVFHTSMGAATKLVGQPKAAPRMTRNPDLVENELIVTLKPGSGVTIEEVAKELGAKIVGRDDKNLTYRLRFIDAEDTADAREELKNNLAIASVDSNYFMHRQPPVSELPIASNSSFSLDPTPVNDPNNVVIGLIDSPVQVNALSADMQKFILNQLAVAGDSATSDKPMHGTFMAEAALQALQKVVENGKSNVKILPVDVYGWNPTTTTFDIGKGIQTAVEHGATIINMSLGTYGDSQYLQIQIRNLANKGIVFFASAGNDPVSDPVFPASYREVTGVTAGVNGQLDSYANGYPGNDMMLPGKSLGQFHNDSYLVTGTSSSSAIASGMAAGLVSKGKLSGGNAQSVLVKQFPPAVR